jgi:hypothetical protein
LLVLSSIVTPNTYCLSFFIFASSNIKNLVVIPVHELAVLILEDLPPSRVSAPDLHVVGFTRALDIPRLIVVSCSDSQGLLMEVPGLALSSIWSLYHEVSVVDQIQVSM